MKHLWVVLFILAGFVLRLYMVVEGKGVIDADEAIVGLMAKHINQGRPWPIFYYGQPYMGSLEAIFAALSFRLFGASGFTLKLVPLFFSLLHIVLVYLLTRRFFGRLAANVAAGLTAFAPAGLVTWSSMARGGFIELVVLGTLSLILSLDILRSRKLSPARFFFLGLVLGVGWWTNNQMIFYLIPIALVLGVWALRFFPFGKSAGCGVLTFLGFFLGSAPFWYYNLAFVPRFQTFTTLTQQQTESGFFQHLSGFFREALPIIFGARRFWSDYDIFPFASPAAYFLYTICLVLFFFCRAAGPADSDYARPGPAGYLLIASFLLVVPLVFSASSFGWLSKAPRYLLPLYSVLFVIAGGAVEKLWNSSLALRKPLSVLLVCCLAGVNIASNFHGGPAVPGQPFVANGERVALDQEPLYRFLRQEEHDHIWTNYWIGYRVAFETDERITFSRFGEPRTLRLPEYEENRRPGFEDDVYVLVPSQARELAPILTRLGYLFRLSVVGGYAIVDHIRPESEWGEPLVITGQQVKVTSRPEWAARMVDNDASTRWGSGMPQKPGMGVEVWFNSETEVAGLELDYGHYVTDVPRHLVVLGLLKDGTWCELVDLGGLDPSETLQEAEDEITARVMRIHFAPRKVKALHLEQRDEGAGPFDWSIAELRVRPPLR